MSIVFVQNARVLQQLCESLVTSPWIAIDTEFTRESTYYAKLGLIQTATKDVLACIDPLAVDIAPLLDVLYNPGITKVLHAGRQDLEVLYDLRRSIPAPLFDTQIAAALLGYPAQVGYATLVEAVCGVKLAKLHTRTNWEARPLSEEQLRYAGEDVEYLRDVYQALDAQLRERHRTEWLMQECEALTNLSLYQNDPAAAYLRLNPGRNVNIAAQPLLKALATWRERTAQSRNRPRAWIAADSLLIEIARAAPKDLDALSRLPQTPATFVQTYGEQILKLTEEMKSAPPELIWEEPHPPSATEQDVARRIFDRVKRAATAHQINPELIATRRTVNTLISTRGGPLTRGWRYELIGQELLALLPN